MRFFCFSIFTLLFCAFLVSCGRNTGSTKDPFAEVKGTPVNLLAANGKYVCCLSELNGLLIADRDSAFAWELFRMIDLGNGKISLRGVNNKYVSVLSDDDNILAAQALEISKAETFEIIHTTDSTIALKAGNGFYVGIDTIRHLKLFASSKSESNPFARIKIVKR
ncbi:MAG: hypothetical protein WCM76_03605 [Bacteroidota bacterium]